MANEISKSKLSAEMTLGHLLNKLRNHDQIIKNLHELKGDGWRKMKYARGLFDRKVGFVSLNDINKEFILLTEPFHCKIKTCSKALYDEFAGENIELLKAEELFESCDIIIIQGEANDFKEKISAYLIDKIKDEALLLVISDDVTFDEDALVNTLKSERINALLNDKLSYAKDVADAKGVMLARI